MNIDDFINNERKEISKFINSKYIIKENKEIFHSPSKKYKLELNHYIDRGYLKNGIEYCHNYMNAKIYNNDKKIFSLNGTTCFYFDWLEIDENNSYLICTEYYQGYGILNLCTLEYNFYLPEEAIKGMGYIWVNGYISPDKNKLAIEGCIWAAPYQIKIFDINDPMKLPYNLLFETSWENEYNTVIGWKNNNEFVFTDSDNIEKSVII